MRNLLLTLLSLLSLATYGQHEVKFVNRYMPNKVYTMTSTSSNESEIDFDGDKAQLEQIKSSGLKLPMIVKGTSETTTTTTTAAQKDDNTIPAKIVFIKASSVQLLNGQELKKENPTDGLIIEGFYDQENKLQIDTIISPKMDEATKEIMRSTLAAVQQQITFPDKPLKVGDSFDQKVPMQIPAGGGKSMNVTVNTNYKLKSITGDKAVFDVIQNLELDMQTDQADIKMTGAGSGVTEFDIKNSMVNKYECDLKMTMKMKMPKMVMTAKISTISKQTTTLN